MTREPQTAETSLRSKVMRSASLSSAQFVSSIGLKLVSTVVLTRLLAPEIYGVFAVVLVYRYILDMVSDLGMRSLALSYEKELDDTFLRTLWTVSLARGLLIALFSALIALVIYQFQENGSFAAESAYSAPVLPWAIAALGGVAFVNSMQSTKRFIQERAMVFGRVTIGVILSNVIGLIATIALAVWLRSVWALVLGNLVQMTCMVIWSYAAYPGPSMRLAFDRPILWAILDRGKWIIGNSLMTATTVSADRLLLGFVMTSTSFGFYHIARQFQDMARQFLRSVHNQMGMQVFRRILKQSNDLFIKNYYRYRLAFDAISGTLSGGLVVAAPLAVAIMFDDRYAGAGPIAQTLALGLLPTGPLALREALMVRREFRVLMFLKALSAITIWGGMGLAIWLGSLTGSIVVIALHTVPETLVLTAIGFTRGWVRPLRELMPFVWFALGALGGWGLMSIWPVG